ncbi:MAG: hypothetical protein IJ409_08275 [Lachnospiraceae bacterium]|nr:hypothetical protein [Lachnospiraceae bacterium]
MGSLKNMFEKKVDERQELELLKVEHIGFWSVYWMLLASVLIQGIFMNKGVAEVLPEFIVFMIACVIIIVGCARKGLWSYQSRKVPGVKSYLLYSGITGVVAGLFFGIVNTMKWTEGDIQTIIISVICHMIGFFAVTFVAFLIVGSIAKKREAKLAEMDCEEDD